MADKYQREYIALRDLSPFIGPDEADRLVAAPAGFDWASYPEFIEIEGRMWRYVGTMDAVPYYRSA